MAGVACASELGRKGQEVVLLDRNDYLQFQPLLYQVASSQLPAEDIARPHTVVFADHPTVTVRTAGVAAIDFTGKSVTLSGGEILQADYLVLAAGSQPNFFGVPGADQHAFPFYAVSDAERLRVHLHDLLQVHCSDTPPPEPLNVVIVGGGPTGVETAGAIAELFAALRDEGLLRQESVGPPGGPRARRCWHRSRTSRTSMPWPS